MGRLFIQRIRIQNEEEKRREEAGAGARSRSSSKDLKKKAERSVQTKKKERQSAEAWPDRIVKWALARGAFTNFFIGRAAGVRGVPLVYASLRFRFQFRFRFWWRAVRHFDWVVIVNSNPLLSVCLRRWVWPGHESLAALRHFRAPRHQHRSALRDASQGPELQSEAALSLFTCRNSTF